MTKPSVLTRLSKALQRSHEQLTVLERLKVINERLARVRSLLNVEDERIGQLEEQLRKASAARVEALARARLEESQPERERADALLNEAEGLRKALEESNAVKGKLAEQVAELEHDVQILRYGYEHELRVFLDALYAQAMDRYNHLAPSVAQAVVEVAAVRRVMMSCRLGDTNGWSGQVLLPGMRPGHGAGIPPILDGASASYGEAVRSREGEIAEQVRAAGFIY